MGARRHGSAPVRVDADLYESARVEGGRSRRSAAQQVDYWARLGRAVSMADPAARRRVEAAVAGELPLEQLPPVERAAANAEIDTAIERHGQAVAFGARLAAEGVTTVALDGDGRLVEHRPDGSTAVLE